MKFKGYRTFVVAVVGALVAGFAILDDTSDWRAWALLGLSALMAGLRAITDTRAGQS